MFGPKVCGRRLAAFVSAFGLLCGGLLAPSTMPRAVAGPGDLVFGVVLADATGNDVPDPTGPVGAADVGVAGVKVTLHDTSITDPMDPEYAGWSVTTDASGAWNFPLTGGWADNAGPFQVTIDAAGVSNDAYSMEGGNGWTPVVGNAQQVTSATFPASSAPLDLGWALATPVWQLSLAVPNDPSGWNGLNVLTGAAPWDPVSNNQGEDSSPADDFIRSSDSLMMNWTVTAAAKTVSLGDQTGPVVLEQTVTLNNGAVVTFARIPGSCVTGSTPASEVRAKPSNAVVAPGAVPPAGTTSLVLTCNLGNMGTAADTPSGYIVPVTLEPLGTSPADSTFSTSARVYAAAPNGAAVATPGASPVAPGPFTITSAPRYDISKVDYYQGWGTFNMPGVGTTQGYYRQYNVLIAADRKTGVEALGSTITVTEDFWAQAPNLTGNPEVPVPWVITGCGVTNHPSLGVVMGRVGVSYDTYQGDRAVADSGTCSYSQSAPGQPATLTFKNVDSTGRHFPGHTVAGGDLSAGPYYVASYVVTIYIPISSIDDLGDGIPGNSSGTLGLSNQLTGFDPPGVSGLTSNYGTGTEPGFCPDRAAGDAHGACDAMSGGGRSNNVTGPATVNYPAAGGVYYEYLVAKNTAWTDTWAALPGNIGSHDGQGVVAPGSTYKAWSRLYDSAGGAFPLDLSQRTGMCTVFDNRVAKLAPLATATGLSAAQAAQLSPDMYAMVILQAYTQDRATQEPLQDLFTFQYGVADLTGDVSNNGLFDAASGRYGGVWTAQRSVQCSDGAPGITWYDSLADVPGGIDAVNAVRTVVKPGLAPGEYLTNLIDFEIGLQQRDTFYAVDPSGVGMVDTGAQIPTGTVFAVFGRPLLERVASYSNWWAGRSYVPQPENGNMDGDRWTVARASASLTTLSITSTLNGKTVGDGASSVGVVGGAQAGRPVIWQVNSTISPAVGMPAAGTARDVVITVTLPKPPPSASAPVTYNASMTAQLPGGTPADSVVTNPDGSTTLTWNLGAWPIGTPIPPRIIYTDSDPMAAAGTQVVLTGTLATPSIPQVPGMTNTHTVVLDQPGSVQVKLSTDGVRYLTDTLQEYTATIRNFSQSLAIQPPVLYDELPVVGDGDSPVAARLPASNFAGTAKLAGPVTADDLNHNPVAGTAYYWTCPTVAMPQRPEDDGTPATDACWKTLAQLPVLTDGSTDFSGVSGWKFESAQILDKVGTEDSVMVLHFHLQPLDNNPGDVYANRFAAFSDTLKQDEHQVLASNETLVGVLGFTLGDLIWEDVDYDGVYTEGVDHPVPAGVVVQVYNAADELVATKVTDANGRWEVNNLPETDVAGTVASGSYYVVIPASQFATGGILADWRASIHNVQPPDNDANENVDHSAVDIPGGGVRSQGLIILTATVDTITGIVISGGEPLGDNVKALATPQLTTDDFTNFTLDLALEGTYGTFQVAKAWTGTVPAWNPAPPTYTGTWTCAHSGATVASGTWSIQGTGDAAMTSTFGPPNTEVPSGSICSATEDAPPTTEFPTTAWSWLTPTTSPDVTIATFQTKRVTITNRADRATGDFNVVKAWSGPIPSWVANTTFTGTWACQNTAEVLDVSGTWSVKGLGPAVLSGVPVAGLPPNTTCTAKEDTDTTTGLPTAALPNTAWVWGVPTIDPVNPVTITTGTPAIVTATNVVGGYTFSKISSPPAGTVAVGTSITYTLLGENTGNEPLTVTVADDLSKVLNHATMTTVPAAKILGGDGSNKPANPVLKGTSLNWAGSLAPGEKVQITYTVTTKDSGVTINNLATSVATTEDGQTITGKGSVMHKILLRSDPPPPPPPPPQPQSHTGGSVAPTKPSGWLPLLLFASGLGALLVRRRYAKG